MTINYYNKLFHSSVGDFEDWGSLDAGEYAIINSGGSPTGLIMNSIYIFAFQEKCYTVFQAQTGDSPYTKIALKLHGANSPMAICNIDDAIWYISDTGEFRKTNGYTDQLMSRKIKNFTDQIINGRSIKDYYADTTYSLMPTMFFDEMNRCLRLYYASAGASYVNKCINYFIDYDIFTMADETYVGSCASAYSQYAYAGIVGNSNGSGHTYYFDNKYCSTTKTGKIDLGWISTGSENLVNVKKVEVWCHPQAGNSSPCNTVLTANVYTDPTNDTVSYTNSTPIINNGYGDQMEHYHVQVGGTHGVTDRFLRIELVDSGSFANYSIEHIFLEIGSEPYYGE